MSDTNTRLGTSPAPSAVHTLDSYITTSKQLPKAISTSAEIRDRGSTFIANIFTATSPEQAKTHVRYVKYVLHGNRQASHEITAWRCMVLKPGKNGLQGPEDFELAAGSMDDGEKWAGDKILKVMQNLAIIDAVVVVSRWYGGTLLGPSRFNHIETCTAEVCQAFKRSEELRESITTLETLDVLLDGLREQMKTLQDCRETQKPSERGEVVARKPDYSSLDLAKARRLIKARENAIQWVKNSLSELHAKYATKE